VCSSLLDAISFTFHTTAFGYLFGERRFRYTNTITFFHITPPPAVRATATMVFEDLQGAQSRSIPSATAGVQTKQLAHIPPIHCCRLLRGLFPPELSEHRRTLPASKLSLGVWNNSRRQLNCFGRGETRKQPRDGSRARMMARIRSKYISNISKGSNSTKMRLMTCYGPLEVISTSWNKTKTEFG
jgi:hypothetical protein